VNNFLYQLPKTMIASLAIILGTILVVLNDPPHSICDTQVESFKKRQKNFLGKTVANEFREGQQTSKDVHLRDLCKRTNSQGGCFELFYQTKAVLDILEGVSRECTEEVGSLSGVKRLLWKNLSLTVKLAWGENPPTTSYEKLNWLTLDDVNVYCRTKMVTMRLYGNESWAAFREKMLVVLPGAKDLSRDDLWQLSIFSENCQKYL